MLLKNKPLRLFLLWILMIVLIRLTGHFTPFADKIFPEISLFTGKITSSISSLFPFSLGDVLYTVLGILLLVWLVKLGIGIKNRNLAKIKNLVSVFLIGLNAFTLVFHLFWGFNYYKTPVGRNSDTREITADELKTLAEFYLQKSIEARTLLPENENGVFESRLSDTELSQELQVSYIEIKNLEELNIRYSRPNLKASLYSTLFSYLGVLGYYNPFTAEAQYNSKMPDTKLLFTKFHETAHQWGAAPESEANFVGFLIGSKTENYAFRYVSRYKALRSILSKLVWVDPEFVKSVLSRYSPEMQRDREYELEIERKYLNRAEDAFSMLNNAYLQLNNQDGLESYGQFVELLVGYHRKYDPIDGF